MADLTPRYAIEQLANNAGNVQRVNTYQRVADAFLGGALVLDRDLLTPPGSPAEGDLYLLPASGTLLSGWSTFTNGNFALYLNSAWLEIVVDADLEGCQVHVQDERVSLIYAGSTAGWVELARSAGDVNAAGTTQGAGTAVTTHFTRVVAVTAASAEAVTLPGVRAGDHRVIYNDHATDTVKLFPASGDSINGGSTNASVDLAAGGLALLWGVSASSWFGKIL